METEAELVSLTDTELKISGGHMADLRAQGHAEYPDASSHAAEDFFRGVYDGLKSIWS